MFLFGRFLFGMGQLPTRALDRETLLVKEALDLEDHLDVAPPVEPMSGTALLGLQHGEFRFPVPQHIGFGLHEFAHVPDAKV